MNSKNSASLAATSLLENSNSVRSQREKLSVVLKHHTLLICFHVLEKEKENAMQSKNSQAMSGRGHGNNLRNRRFPSYLDKLKSGEKKLLNARDAQQVFKILSKDYGTAGNSKRLVLNFDQDMLPVLKEATELLHPDPSEPMRLLEALGDEALTQGVYKDRTRTCFEALYGAQDFFPNLALRLAEGKLSGPKDHSTIAWFLLQLGITGNGNIHSDPLVSEVIEFLKSSQQAGFPKLSDQLAVVFYKQKSGDEDTQDDETGNETGVEMAVASLGATRSLMRPPGVRDHDNDKTNFRAISIVPTTSELSCTELPFLPSPLEIASGEMRNKITNESPDGDVILGDEIFDTKIINEIFDDEMLDDFSVLKQTRTEGIGNLEAFALERQFRLMREDLIGTVKEELAGEWKLHAHKRRRLLANPSIVGFGSKPEPHVVVRVELPLRLSQRLKNESKNKAIEFFEKGPGKRVLQKGTLVVLIIESDEKGRESSTRLENEKIEIRAVGTVVERLKPLKVLKGKRALEVGISFTPESMRFITPLLQRFKSEKSECVSIVGEGCKSGLFNASAGLFSLEPILKALKRMHSVPMSDQLIHLREPKQPSLSHGGKSFEDLKSSLQEAVVSDKAQKRALEEIFRSNVVLVQGPPGTGKTYIGVQMVKAMLRMEKQVRGHVQPLRILCLCYTNHALDSFLLDLIKAGIPENRFVRLGSSPKIDPKIQPRCLGEVNSVVKQKFDRNESAAYRAIKTEAKQLEKRFKELVEDITRVSTWGRSMKWWKVVSDWMDLSDHYEKVDELRVPCTAEKDGFVQVGEDGKSVGANYLWERWFNGMDRGIFHNDGEPSELWKLEKKEREMLIEQWHQEWIQPTLDDLENVIEKLQKNTQALRELRRANDLKALNNAKIIGCTTVAAAKFQGMINPNVVIVEEAGEILESHVLANLGDSCEQLIMIGDHKQLRPKIDNYRLHKESDNGFDLNVSLFERLVTSTASHIPVFPLTIQHRMRPEISRLIRGMGLYESLEDHENTKGRKSILGVTNDVVFMDHRFPEKADEATAAVGMETKVNPFEVDMVVGIAKYIIQQGQYSAEQITILTPYLGQLSLIRKKLQQTKIGSYISDQDFGDLARQDLNDHIERQNDSTIRIATVDNFQGEESEVVIISLVRSNPQGGRIGFLASEERINVLFSRAREGMFVVGNLESLTECSSASGRKLWCNMKRVLEDNNSLYDHFPAKCQKHSTLHQIRNPEDFDRLAPEGGCGLRCTLLLDCGHRCPRKCHGHVKFVHSMIKCKENVEDMCSNGHKQLRECYSIVKCRKTMEWFCPRGHSIRGVCMKGRPKDCSMCDKLDRLEEEAERKREERAQEIQKRKQQLMLTRAELTAVEERKMSAEKLSMIEYEQKLLEKQLSKLLAVDDDETNDSREIAIIDESQDDPVNTCGVIKIIDENNDNDDENSVSNIVNDREGKVGERKDNTDASDHSNAVDDHVYEKKEKFIDDDGERLSGGENEVVEQDVIDGDHLTQSAVNPKSLFSDRKFCEALARFQEEKYLEADDLIEICLKETKQREKLKLLEAFKYILYDSLDPSGKHDVDEHVDMKRPNTFEEAVKCWARFIVLASSDEYPSITIHTAELFLSYRENSCRIAKDIIDIGRQRAHDVVKKARSAILSSSKQKSERETEIEKDWKRVCKRDPDAPSIVEEVMMMIGLFDVKRALIDQYHQIKVSQRQGDSAVSSYNVRFEGNPGTGKTTIARHYSKFLQQLTILPENAVTLDVTAASLKHKGISHLEEMLEEVKKAGGGVIFIDEAYQLSTDQTGEKLLDFILPISESLDGPFGKLVWIFAGYPKEMEKLFEHNVGLPSRFPQKFRFADYNASQMEAIFRGFIEFKEKTPETSNRRKKGKQLIPLGSSRRPAYLSSHGETYRDRFEITWTCNHDDGLWHDDYGNVSGYHPMDIGTAGNPLACSKDNRTWTHNGNSWITSDGESQKHYPGSPNPKAVVNKVPRNPPFVCENEKYLRIAMRRLERQSNRPGFGNARAVRVLFDRVRVRQARRITEENKKGRKPNDFVFTRNDLLGVPLTESQLKNSEAYSRLQKMEGLLPVKEQIDHLIKMGASNLKREEAERPLLEIILNRVFLGNPGTGKFLMRFDLFQMRTVVVEIPDTRFSLMKNYSTGKTTVAKIYGQLLAEMGLLSKGEVIVKNPSDFKGDVIGSSEKNTRDILRAAEGNVLVIDEAYALCNSKPLNGTSDPYGTAVIDTFVEQIQARPGDDRAVVMLGYRKEMEELFKNVNPGLSRRFQLEQAFVFPDYDDNALVKILVAKAKESELKVSITVAKRAVRLLARARAKPNFGNAGAVDILLSRAKERMQKRDGISNKLTLEDFDMEENDEFDEEELDSLFDGLIGMEDVRNKLEELKNIVKFAKSRGEKPRGSMCFNYLFLGNPGTGKTTVARCMGKMFKMLGLLPDDTVYECTPKDFITGFVGQAGSKTTDLFEKSRGGVLFIDEAYQLDPRRGGHFMTEVVDELCAKLTDDEFKGKVLVLLAGYDADTNKMLAVNPGLKSRFAERIFFRDLTPVATRDLIVLKLASKKIPLVRNDVESDALLELATTLASSEGFANGRDVTTVCEKTYAQVAKHSIQSDGQEISATLDDVETAINGLISSRKPQKTGLSCQTLEFSDQATSSRSREPPITAIDLEQTIEGDEEGEEIEEVETVDANPVENPFSTLPTNHLKTLNDIVDEMGWNTFEGIERLLSSKEDTVLIPQLMERLEICEDAARSILESWKKSHKEAKQQKLGKKTKGMEAIWHCAVCGRGGRPQPICYVAPYISGYRPISLG